MNHAKYQALIVSCSPGGSTRKAAEFIKTILHSLLGEIKNASICKDEERTFLLELLNDSKKNMGMTRK